MNTKPPGVRRTQPGSSATGAQATPPHHRLVPLVRLLARSAAAKATPLSAAPDREVTTHGEG